MASHHSYTSVIDFADGSRRELGHEFELSMNGAGVIRVLDYTQADFSPLEFVAPGQWTRVTITPLT